MSNKTPLPRVAMFHGGGSTPQIFKRQCEALERHLGNSFEFVFFGAPFQSGPGAGVLPFFSEETWGPYLNWFTKGENGDDIPDGTAGNYDDEEGIDRVVRLIRECGPGGKWVGCLGFSQGTRTVAGLLRWQQWRNNKETVDGDIDIKFGILCMGAGAPMSSTIPESLLKWDEANSNRLICQKDEQIRIPTLHLHGLSDSCYEAGKVQMKSHFDQKTVTCIEIDYHHAMPWHPKDVSLFVESIKKLYPQRNAGSHTS
ncbi:BgTH12-00417 [Blumeria graminis f. sp. triticale]|uniref:Bgt-3020 n=3 Tax=Blumeria graminis TaxID=34373 RepID=A0A061HJ10_BLUGR|nr:hypothetical protein BGT96224_3020 [Blumeria graminis f. sp. tritici 96224]CAD6504917.1 BgTH12-00417 [Blumeria graminis f. sp. triticale]VDB92936.1 Bgt-3020 [Blumeria graminis f. sp. tritici]